MNDAAPERIAREAQAFALVHPEATRLEWLVFAVRLATAYYQMGVERGREWERESKSVEPTDEPARVRGEFEWMLPEHMTENELREKVPGEFDELSDEQRIAYLSLAAQLSGGFRLMFEPVRNEMRDGDSD